jgi:hypothetical protein
VVGPTWLRSTPMIVALATAAGLLLIVSRQPHVVINPQLWAEDGKVWFLDAYRYGPLRPLLWSDGGYLNTFQRLAGAAGLLVPIPLLPLFFSVVSLLVQVLPVAFLASNRLEPIYRRRWVRLVAGFVYLALPGTSGIGTNITGTEWHLAFLACLVVIAPRPKQLSWQSFDAATILLSGLSGPFCVFLLPAALTLAWRRGSRSQWSLAGLLLALSAVQLAVLAVNLPLQHSDLLTAVHVTPIVGIRLVALRMLMVPVLGTRLAFFLAGQGGAVVAAVIVAVAATLTGLALRQARLEERLLMVFGLLSLGAALVLERRLWGPMLHSTAAHRYWFFPMLTWLLVLAVLTFRTRWHLVSPVCAAILAVSLLVAVPSDWAYPSLPNQHFQHSATEFRLAGPGQSVKFVENPPGWSFVLTKKP